MKRIDLEFNGQLGLYTLSGNTAKGRNFIRRSVSFQSWQGNPTDGITVEGNDLCQDITDGAFADGLTVFVNGREYIGKGKLAA